VKLSPLNLNTVSDRHACAVFMYLRFTAARQCNVTITAITCFYASILFPL
jgi:hypothetical protein